MPFVAKRNPFSEPNYDVFTPARRTDPRGLIEGAVLEGNRHFVPWIGLSTVRELALKYADKTGLVERSELELALQGKADAEELLRQANERIAELEAHEERVAGLVAQDGYKLVRVQGRPPVKKVTS